ncbi:uncharacterized protein MONBRDRAFT_37087 [Monosiga brevicollis MX1]|uniref:Uncharacterized protein n=1 Tax=Monosiga brevicollis TaxID=81824 RepID=A9UZH9_MONBE|nr:uncharacterized protein MONBRDRAFT_37087 [Monosiga brevicollis MX1]EDQ89373.1 predicted protein [Monosiga brevicollis MX1]|eukprot:XP_001745949.1 hypothetical protein [Monosiga brevicollis MX1]
MMMMMGVVGKCIGRRVALAMMVVVAVVVCGSRVEAALKAGGPQWTPIKDEPYRELLSLRASFANQTRIEGWPQLPFDSIYGMYAANASRAVLNTDQGAYLLNLEAAPTSLKVTSLNVPLKPSDFLVPLATVADTFVRISTAGASSYACSASSCVQQHASTASLPDITAVEVLPGNKGVLIGTTNGLYQIVDFTTSLDISPLITSIDGIMSLTPCGDFYAVGTEARVFRIDHHGAVLDWEWVTRLADGAGGVYGAPPRAMRCDARGQLFVANEISLNQRDSDGLVSRFDFKQGMPMNNASRLAIEPGTEAVWVGTFNALLRYSRGQDDPDWRYFHGDRFLPHDSNITALLAMDKDHVVVATPGGLAVLVWQEWTLRQKADHYYNILQARHNRYGMVSECGMSTYGQLSTCQSGPSDNNGLWTSLLAVAYTYAQELEPSATHSQALTDFQNGMRLLVNITHVRGLMARTCVSPEANHNNPDPNWHNSSAPGFAGWAFKGDASSDEVVGHMFAHMVIATTASDESQRNLSRDILLDIINYINNNDYYLIDVTGLPTRWGIWNPLYINHNRSWSDERGLNPMQILAYLVAGRALARTPAEASGFEKSINVLCNSTNQYARNMLNLKIESPDDNNYSDDELTFLPFYTMALGLKAAPFGSLDTPLAQSLERTWLSVRGLRAAPWNVIYTLINGSLTNQDDVDNIAWNLRTWPLELIDFPMTNTIRRDIFMNPEGGRNGEVYNDDVRRILPAYERSQLRWNSDPHDLDGGSGTQEGDPGAWLLPYWMARHAGLIVP